MAAYVNRTISVLNGSGAHGASVNANDPRNTSSPLQRFVKGKRKINDIFGEIEDYVIDSASYING